MSAEKSYSDAQTWEAISRQDAAGRPEVPRKLERVGSRRKLLEATGVFLLFGALVCVSTWPLILNLSQYLPPHCDPRMIAWNMASNARRLLSNPLLLFHGNDFYPYGTTKAFSEILLVPSLFNMPIFLLSGNPVLSYNITLLFLWSLSGLTMYLFAREMLRHRWGALLAGVVWALSPFRTDYYLEFNMQMCFAVPLVVLYWYRFLRTQRLRDAAFTFLFLGIQVLSCWNWAILVSLYLVVFSAVYLLLKWRGWKIKRLVGVVPVMLGFAAAVYPFASPYFSLRGELGIERDVAETTLHSADVLTYAESGPVWMYRLSPTYSHAETSLFPGFAALLFLALSSAYFFKREARFRPGKGVQILNLAVVVGLLFNLLLTVLRASKISENVAFLRAIHFSTMTGWVAGLSLLLLGLRGWKQKKAKVLDRAFNDKDVLGAFLLVGFVMFLLSLGPYVHVKGRVVGHGPYYHLYGALFPLRAVRVATRFGGLVLFSMAILAGLGAKWFSSAPRKGWKPVGWLAHVAFLFAALEYFPAGLNYAEFRWDQRPPVYDLVVSDSGDFAIAEWPCGWRERDGDFLLWSLVHQKRVICGTCRWRRRMPPRTERLAKALQELPSAEHAAQSLAELRLVYPVKYFLLHGSLLPPRKWRPWEGFVENPPGGLTLLRVYDDHDYLFAAAPVVERGREFSRDFSYEFLLKHPLARFRLRAPSPRPVFTGSTISGIRVRVYFNHSLLLEDSVVPDWKNYAFRLRKPYRKVSPNCVRIVAVGSDGEEGIIELDGFSLSEK